MSRIVSGVKIDPNLTEDDCAHLQLDDKHFDVLLNSCSSVFSAKVLTQRLISSVQIASEFSDFDVEVAGGAADGATNDQLMVSSAIASDARHSKVTPEEISRKFGCGIETAKKTLKSTTQLAVRHAQNPFTRRYRTDIMQSSHRRLRTTWFCDTMFSRTKSLRGNVCAEVFTNGKFINVQPMKSKAGYNVGHALQQAIEENGIPSKIVMDDAKETTGPNTPFMQTIRRYHIDHAITEPYSHWQNRAEGAIRELRRKWRLLCQRRRVPNRLWDYALVHFARVLSLTVRGDDEFTPVEEITGDTPDISEYIDFQFYDWVWFVDNPHNKEEGPKIARWLGVSHRVGSAMCFYVLVQNCQVLSRSSVQHISHAEQLKDEIIQRLKQFDHEVVGRLNDPAHTLPETEENAFWIEDDDDGNGDHTGNSNSETKTSLVRDDPTDIALDSSPMIDADDVWSTPEAYDEYLNAEILVPDGDGRSLGRVKKRLKDKDGNPIGRRHQNFMMDTRLYEVELADGSLRDYYANTIAECMFSQVDSEGRSYRLLKEITNHKSDGSAILKEDGWLKTPSGREVRKRTTRGWHLLCEWKEGTSDWVPLKDLKESFPVEVAEYAKANKIDDEPAFAWWVKDVLRKRNRIISKVKSKYWTTSTKFGIRLPKTVEEALRLDTENGNTFWRDAIEKEMKKIQSMNAFERWDGGSPEDLLSGRAKLPGFTQISCHMIFDVKMDGKFTRKARFVANGSKTESVPSHLTYSSVVTRESVRIAFLYAALNNIDILGCDVGNAYLNAPCQEKIWVKAGKEFGDDEGSVMIIKRALYGLRSSGFSWRQMLAQTLDDMGYVSTRADPDVYRRKSYKPDGTPYYELVLTYVDDILVVSADPWKTMDILKKVYVLKEEARRPDRYLGANIARVQMKNGDIAWSMSADDYVKSSLDIVKEMLAKDGQRLNMRYADRPMPRDYHPEVDTTPELSAELSSRYHQLIGMLRWACELGRIDILLEVSLMSSYLCSPREGHLENVYRIFSYLDKHQRSNMVFDPQMVELDEDAFADTDWKDSIYGKVEEELPPNMPKPLGNPVAITCFVDANHAGDKVTRRSQTGFIIYLNNSPIDWYSKKQNTCESSTFGSEFVAMRIATERLRALRYKLRMFGIPIEGAATLLGDNESVVNSASKVEARLNKKHNAICFHTVREACAGKWLRVGWEPTASNIADLFTKMLPTDIRRNHLGRIFIRASKIEEKDPPD